MVYTCQFVCTWTIPLPINLYILYILESRELTACIVLNNTCGIFQNNTRICIYRCSQKVDVGLRSAQFLVSPTPKNIYNNISIHDEYMIYLIILKLCVYAPNYSRTFITICLSYSYVLYCYINVNLPFFSIII